MFPKLRTITSVSKCCSRLVLWRNYQVTVVGGAGGVGQPLSLLLKTNPLVTKVKVHDIQKITPGVAVDLSHMPSDSCVEGFGSEGELEKALTGANIVVVTAGVASRGSNSGEEQFKKNSEIVGKIMMAIAKVCPCAFVEIITDPINSIVPLAAEAMRRAGVYDQRKLFGVTNLNLMRAQTFYAKATGVSPSCACVPVVGGNSPCTIVPLFSQANPPGKLDPAKILDLVKKVRNAGKDVVDAKCGEGSATLTMAYAASGFTQGLLEALAGSPNVQYAYVQSNDFGTCFFSGPVLLDCNGVFEMQMIGQLSKQECEMLEVAIDDIRKDVLRGQVRFSDLYPRKSPPC